MSPVVGGQKGTIWKFGLRRVSRPPSMPPCLCLSHEESSRGLGGDLLEGSSYCELGSLVATVTSWVFTRVGCVHRIAASSPFLCHSWRQTRRTLADSEASLGSWTLCRHIQSGKEDNPGPLNTPSQATLFSPLGMQSFKYSPASVLPDSIFV